MLQRLLEYSPDLLEHLKDRLTCFNIEAMRGVITDMTEFEIPIPLSPVRAAFVCRLTEARHQALINTLTG